MNESKQEVLYIMLDTAQNYAESTDNEAIRKAWNDEIKRIKKLLAKAGA